MDLILAVRQYISKFLSDASGMKIALLDKETTGIVSLVYTLSEILKNEVYLVERLDNKKRKPMKHLKGFVFVRPTTTNIASLCQELKHPLYGQYYLYFTNTLSDHYLKLLAESDENETVKEEFYGDYYPLANHLFSLNLFSVSVHGTWRDESIERAFEGLKAVLLSLKKRPNIRYQENSVMCKQLAFKIMSSYDQESQLFNFRRSDVTPILLILDRRDDPITPLLNQWTYEAMVHEWLTINNQRVDLTNVLGIESTLKDIVLSPEEDTFFKKNMYENFGEICQTLKELVDDFKNQSKSSKNIETIEDMRTFIDMYPQFKQLSGIVSKHVTLISELSRIVNSTLKFEISEVEQDLVSKGHHETDFQKIKELLEQPNVTDLDRIRLILLYFLRHENQPNNGKKYFRTILKNIPVSKEYIACIDSILAYGGSKIHSSDLFGNNSFFSITKRKLEGLKGVKNIYTQHEPLLKKTLESLVKGKLNELEFPSVTNANSEKVQDIIVFVVGGITYEESRTIAILKQNYGNVNIILGGTCIHNCESFLKEVLSYSSSLF